MIGEIVNKSIPFLLLPILTRYLTPEDFGIIAVFTTLVSIIGVFTGLSTHGAINVNFFKMEKEDFKKFVANVVILLNISVTLIFLLILLISPFVLQYIQISLDWILIAAIMAFAQFLTTINLTLWMAEQKPIQYTIYQIFQTLITTFLSLTLIVGFGFGLEGQLIALSMGSISFGVISFIFVLKRGYLIFQPNRHHIQEALHFGIPLIPHALGGWIRTGADRMILISMVGSAATGIYSVGYQVGLVISVLAAAFNKAWSPYLYKTLSSDPSYANKKKLVKFTYLYFIVIVFGSLFFAWMMDIFTPYLLGKQFIGTSQYVYYIALGFAFQGMYFMVTNYIFFAKKTHILAIVTFGTAAVHLLLLYFLIDLNGAIGAAQANTISFALTFLLVWLLSQKIYPMPWLSWK